MSTHAPGVIPYVDFHQGPRRVLAIELVGRTKLPPVVSIDGRPYVVSWGTAHFEVPADRACHVSVEHRGERFRRYPWVLLGPEAPPVLTFRSAAVGRRESLG